MGEVMLQLGATVDVASGAEVKAAADRVLDGLRSKIQPYYVRLTGTGIVATGGPDLIIDLGGPPTGKAWDLRALAVMKLPQPYTSSTANASILIGDPTLFFASALLVPKLTLPTSQFWSRGQAHLYGHAQDHIYVIINAGTAAEQYVITGGVIEVNDSRQGDYPL